VVQASQGLATATECGFSESAVMKALTGIGDAPTCRSIPVCYTLTIQVTTPDSKDEKIVVTPKFEGGGLDLP
jgi:hypothetical protein